MREGQPVRFWESRSLRVNPVQTSTRLATTEMTASHDRGCSVPGSVRQEPSSPLNQERDLLNGGRASVGTKLVGVRSRNGVWPTNANPVCLPMGEAFGTSPARGPDRPAGLRHRVRSSRWQRCRPLGRRPASTSCCSGGTRCPARPWRRRNRTISRFENGARRTVLYRMGRELAACVIERHAPPARAGAPDHDRSGRRPRPDAWRPRSRSSTGMAAGVSARF